MQNTSKKMQNCKNLPYKIMELSGGVCLVRKFIKSKLRHQNVVGRNQPGKQILGITDCRQWITA